jgi:hypothetical protein
VQSIVGAWLGTPRFDRQRAARDTQNRAGQVGDSDAASMRLVVDAPMLNFRESDDETAGFPC